MSPRDTRVVERLPTIDNTENDMNNNLPESGRYWAPRGKPVQLDAHCYTVLGAKKFRAYSNPHLRVTYELIGSSEVLVLLGEPGSGKSFELDVLKKQAQSASGRMVCALDLGKYADAGRLDAALRRVLKDCIDGEIPTILFLDALDECRVNIKRAETVIEDVLGETTPDALRVVIACRTPAWPHSLEDTLREHWRKFKDSAINVVEIAPYSREQVAARLHEQEINERDFFEALEKAGAHGLSLQPLGLNFLMSQFEDGTTFSSSRWVLYERGCAALLKESKRRRDDGNLSLPDPRLRLHLAGFIAACALLTNKVEIRLDAADEVQSDFSWLDIGQLAHLPLRVGGNNWLASREQFTEVMQSGLFMAKGSGAFVFAHRTYAEFLAAHFITSLGQSVEEVMSVLTLPDGSGRLVPQLRELAAWISQKSQQILSRVLTAEPMMVFDSSVSLTDEAHTAEIFDKLSDLIEQRRFPIYDHALIRSYGKLAHPGLLEKLIVVLRDKSRLNALRQFAADVASACGLVQEIPALVSIALDASDEPDVRQCAANAIRDSGPPALKRNLFPLMEGGHPEDVDDELKGIALHCAIDLDVPIGSLVADIKREKRSSYSGSYAHALRRLENTDVLSSDVPQMLAWLQAEFGEERLEHSWEDFLFHMFSKAALAVISSNEHWSDFGVTAWLALSNHHRLSGLRETRGFDTGLQLAAHPERRLRVFESLLNAAEGEPRLVAGTMRFGTGLLTESDGTYLVATYERYTDSERVRLILANLILGYVHDSDGVVREWLLESAGPHATDRDGLLAGVAVDYVEEVLLDSANADSSRKTLALMRQADTPSLPTPQKARSINLLLGALTRAEGGDTWEWLNILSYLRFDGDFLGYHTFSREVTTSPLWPTLDEAVQKRLYNCAFAYLGDTGPVEQDLAPNQSNGYEDGGVAALVLLYQADLHGSTEYLNFLKKWIVGVARYNLDGQPRTVVNQLLDLALSNAPDVVMPLLTHVCQRYLAHDIARLPDFAEEFMPESLRRALETLLPTLQSEDAFSALSKFLVEIGSHAAVDSLVARIETLPDLSVPFATKSMAMLAQREPERLIRSIWPRLYDVPQAVIALAAEMHVSFSSQVVPLLLIDANVTEHIFETLEASFPSSSDIRHGGIVKWQHYVQDFRNACLYSLRERASAESIAVLQRISERHRDRTWIASLLHDAEQKAARDSWIPYDEQEAVAALGLAAGRVVRTEAELHAAVMDELTLIAEKISSRSAQPAVYFLWDETSKRPKQEPRLCDWLTIELRDRLSPRGAIVNREVQVRSHSPTGIGERTDILVEVSDTACNELGSTIRVVIEVKGCWNDDLLSAPASQLRDNYMTAFNTGTGVYLVMWFMCEKWTDEDRRKQSTRRLISGDTVEVCREVVATACGNASSEARLISPVVIDCSY